MTTLFTTSTIKYRQGAMIEYIVISLYNAILLLDFITLPPNEQNYKDETKNF